MTSDTNPSTAHGLDLRDILGRELCDRTTATIAELEAFGRDHADLFDRVHRLRWELEAAANELVVRARDSSPTMSEQTLSEFAEFASVALTQDLYNTLLALSDRIHPEAADMNGQL